MRTRLVVLVSVLTLGLIAIWSAAAQADGVSRAFRGHVSGEVTFVPTTDPACKVIPVHTVSAGTGHATHLGPMSMSASHCAGNTIAGSLTLSGTNGSVFMDYQGDCTPVPPFPETVTCTLRYTVTGGTARFQDARGAGDLTALVHPDLSLPDPTQGTWQATWTWRGSIQY